MPPAADPPPLEEAVITQFGDEDTDLPQIMALVDTELSEPYSVFTYRYFIANWPQLCYLAHAGGRCVGAVVCKADRHRGRHLRGYLAMLVVDKPHRSRGLGRALVNRAITRMAAEGVEEVMLEAEVTNGGALALYRSLGFVRDKRLHRYYLNGVDAFRLKLLLPLPDDGGGEGAGEREGVGAAPD